MPTCAVAWSAQGLGLAVYYGVRLLGGTPLEALLFSTTASAMRLAYSALSSRKFDPIAAFLMSADGITLIVGLVSRSPQVTMLGQHIPGVVFLMFVIVGLARHRPITESLLTWLRPNWVQRHAANDGDAPDLRAYHRTHIRLSIAVATACLVHLAAAAIAIFTLPVDIARGTLGLLALITDALIAIIVIGGVGRFLRRDKPAASAQLRTCQNDASARTTERDEGRRKLRSLVRNQRGSDPGHQNTVDELQSQGSAANRRSSG
ncbi:VC0807 family protein (plasmid) [Mycolicibacterium aichiense]|uniref:VC0807 family protein n=1 Tax=Mycolicibacterium aichiense TaxID=1799 RepID=UPI003D6704FE